MHNNTAQINDNRSKEIIHKAYYTFSISSFYINIYDEENNSLPKKDRSIWLCGYPMKQTTGVIKLNESC